ncbi:MAG: hypothetical protein LBG52_02210 [Candidatus Peribacteria bacterium]|nr:hypothetical protein [Candidatus Peribacteria bacterium]
MVNHNLNLERPIVQVYDAFNTQDTEVEISKMDSNNVTIKSTSSEPLVVVII